jgi:hypothetical protein
MYAAAALLLLLVIALVSGYFKYRTNDKTVPGKLSSEEARRDFKMDSLGRLDSKESVKALKMDSLSKLDSKENVQPNNTDKQRKRAAGKADSRGK